MMRGDHLFIIAMSDTLETTNVASTTKDELCLRVVCGDKQFLEKSPAGSIQKLSQSISKHLTQLYGLEYDYLALKLRLPSGDLLDIHPKYHAKDVFGHMDTVVVVPVSEEAGPGHLKKILYGRRPVVKNDKTEDEKHEAVAHKGEESKEEVIVIPPQPHAQSESASASPVPVTKKASKRKSEEGEKKKEKSKKDKKHKKEKVFVESAAPAEA